MSKKLRIFLALLLIVNLILNLIAPEISKLSFIGIWVTAMAFWLAVCFQEDSIKILEQNQRVNFSAIDTTLDTIVMLNKLNKNLKKRYGINGHIDKICAMPKVTSATGQIYVDFDEVMKILEGTDIVER